MIGRGRVVSALVLAILAVCPATAGAITVSDDGVTTHLTGGPEDNQVTIAPGPGGTVLVTDTAGVTAGDGCTASGAGATCGTGGTIQINATLGDGTNSLKGVGDAMSWGAVFGIDVVGGPGADTIGPDPRAGAPWDISGGGGDDKLYGSPDGDLIHGGDGNDEIHGGAGGDVLYGDAGNDTIFGDDGDDTINSDDGAQDHVTCGPGEDTVVLDSSDKTEASGGCEGLNDNGNVTTPDKKAKVPKPTAYGKHCTTHHHHKHCVAAKPLAGKGYSGKRLTLKVSHGKVAFDVKQIVVECGFVHDDFNLTNRKGGAKVSAKGTFADTSSFSNPSTALTGKVYVGGAFDGHHARGYIVVNATLNSDDCTSGVIRWTAET